MFRFPSGRCYIGPATIALALTSCAVTDTERSVGLDAQPGIAEPLLQQHRFQEAYDLLIAAEKASPTNWSVKRQLARTLGGWLEFSANGQAVRVAGLDRPVEAYRKYYGDPHRSFRVWATRPEVPKYSLVWYQFLWESYWFAKQAGKQNDKLASTAAKFYRKARSTDDFAALRALGAEGDKVYRYFRANR